MTKYNALNVNLSNSQLYKLKSGINYGTQATVNLWLLILMMRLISRINYYYLIFETFKDW